MGCIIFKSPLKEFLRKADNVSAWYYVFETNPELRGEIAAIAGEDRRIRLFATALSDRFGMALVHFASWPGSYGLKWSAEASVLPVNRYLTWARMSIIDTESGQYDFGRVKRFLENLPDVAVGLSFTVTPKADVRSAKILSEMIESAPNGSHVKYVEEGMNGAPRMMDILEAELKDFNKSLFQRWNKGVPGVAACHISKLRPLVNADGFVYPCCTVGDYEDLSGYKARSRMCHWRDFRLETPVFNGAGCCACYWSTYNDVLDGLLAPLDHERFI